MTFNDNANIGNSNVSGGSSGGGRLGGGGGFGGGGIRPGGMRMGGGIGGVILTIIVVLIYNFAGGDGAAVNPAAQNNQVAGDSQVQQQLENCKTGADANRDDVCLVKGTVATVEAFWTKYFPEATGKQYQSAVTTVYSGSTQSSCGTASNQTGPFYCPLDKGVYVDASFFGQLSSTYGADSGQLAKEYVIAHEYGHHVQDLLGALGRAQQDPKGPESGGVRVELQADCYAGLWAHYATTTTDNNGTAYLKAITPADIKSALSAASAVGDDRIQKKSTGRVNQDTWTHGSSASRQKWFTRGYETGQINSCDTFNAQTLD